MTSILKGMKVSTYEAIMAAGNDEFDFAPYVGTLENDGVGIAPFHDFESKVNPELPGELDDGQGRHHRRLDHGQVLPAADPGRHAQLTPGGEVDGRRPPRCLLVRLRCLGATRTGGCSARGRTVDP